MHNRRPSLSALELGTIRLVPVREHHAEYIYSLRIDPSLNEHLSAAPPSAAAQAQWIRGYLEREAAGDEFYFLIERRDGTPCGTVRLYDFSPVAHPDSFSWGSWVLDKSKTRYAAVESALLVYEMGFERLGFSASHFEVRKGNTKVIAFHQKFGAQVIAEDDESVYMRLTRADFEQVKPKLMALVSRASDGTAA
jgi:RimJ/RimL family protein N-acetyltransferase